jgi:hypothetical protein
MREINPIEFGEMKSDLKHVRGGVDNHTAALERIEAKLDKFATKDDLGALTERVKAIEDRNSVVDGNIFIKAIRPAENKLVAFIIQVTGLVLLIGPTLFIIYSQSIQKKPEVIKEIVNVKERIEK